MKITIHEKRIDELEQYSRMDNVLVSGLKVNHTSYLRAVVQSNFVEINKIFPVAETNSCEEQILSLLRSKPVEILKNDIDNRMTKLFCNTSSLGILLFYAFWRKSSV